MAALAVTELSSFLLLLLLLLVAGPSLCAAEASADADFVRARCAATLYRSLCRDSLSGHAAAIRSSPTKLASTALSIALAAAKKTSRVVSALPGNGGLAPREAAAVGDCVMTVGSAVDELQRSMEAMGKVGDRKRLRMRMADIQTWVSAALTNENTCMDGFAGRAADGATKGMVRGYVVRVAQLTSNALALINGLD